MIVWPWIISTPDPKTGAMIINPTAGNPLADLRDDRGNSVSRGIAAAPDWLPPVRNHMDHPPGSIAI